jgi:hypothetical protein
VLNDFVPTDSEPFSLGSSDSNLYDSNHTDERRSDISRSTLPQSSLRQGAGGSPSGMGREIARAKAEGSGRALGQGSESDVESFGENLVLKSIRAKGIWHYDPDGRLIRSTDFDSVRSKAEVINALVGKWSDESCGWFRASGSTFEWWPSPIHSPCYGTGPC